MQCQEQVQDGAGGLPSLDVPGLVFFFGFPQPSEACVKGRSQFSQPRGDIRLFHPCGPKTGLMLVPGGSFLDMEEL